jgi:hypothetical protein
MSSEIFKYALAHTVKTRSTQDLEGLLPAYREQRDQAAAVVDAIESELRARKRNGEG